MICQKSLDAAQLINRVESKLYTHHTRMFAEGTHLETQL